LRRLTRDGDSRDAVARVTRELRRRHDDAQERRRRHGAAQRAGENPRRGVGRGATIAGSARRAGDMEPRSAH
jgi:hypothetical protein